MLGSIQKIWSDDTLYGHCLTTLPAAIWDFAISDELVHYTQPDPGTAKRYFLIFENYVNVQRNTNGEIIGTNIGTNSLLFKYGELAVRRIGGSLLAAGSALSLAPLGFAIKIIHNTFSNA